MSTVRFNTEIGEDQTIRPPEGVTLTPGKAEVIVVQASDAAAEPGQTQASAPGIPAVAKDLAGFARQQETANLPADFAMNHDHYLHGAPKGIDQP